MKPADNVIPLKPAKRSRAELAFLPAALEIADTPPSPVGRAIVWAVVAVLARPSLGLPRQGRHRGDGAGQDHSLRAHQDHPALRDGRGARHLRQGRRDGRRRRSPHRLDPTLNAAEQNHFKADLGGRTRHRAPQGGAAAPSIRSPPTRRLRARAPAFSPRSAGIC